MPAFFNAPEISGGVMDIVFDNSTTRPTTHPCRGTSPRANSISITDPSVVFAQPVDPTRPPTRASTSAASSTSTKRIAWLSC
eukprot:238638-Rhodomonas_salina.3